MKAGLLICDHVKKEYQNEFGDYPDMFLDLFPDFEWTLFDVDNGDFPQDMDACDVYFATGSKHSVYEDLDWIQELKELIRTLYNRGKCFIGFCFGHQLLGAALGGKVGKSHKGWCVGVHEFNVIEQKEWMDPAQPQISLLMMCQDQILTLPINTTVIAESALCPYAIIQVGERILGIQAHPEFSKDYDKMLMETRMNKMGDNVALKGIESLENDVHSNVVVEWINEFVNAKI